MDSQATNNTAASPASDGADLNAKSDGGPGASVERSNSVARKPLFDPSKLTVEELRDELRARGENTVGLKFVLVERLLASIASPGGVPHLMCQAKPLKRPANKKEPLREEFNSQEEFQLAWIKWRETRDNNNESVKRSRICAKMRKVDHEQLFEQRDEEYHELDTLVRQLRDESAFLNKVLRTPEMLDTNERDRLIEMVTSSSIGIPQPILLQGVSINTPR